MSDSHGASISLLTHPWDWEHLELFSDADLRDFHDAIEMEFINRNVSSSLVHGLRLTQHRIQRILQGRGTSRFGLSSGFVLGGVGGVGFLHRASPGFVIGQTVQQGVIDLPAPRPNITFQTVPAPLPNITIQNIAAPQLVAPLQAPELPKRIKIRDQWGNIIEERNKTEREKIDREYEEWKVEFGAK